MSTAFSSAKAIESVQALVEDEPGCLGLFLPIAPNKHRLVGFVWPDGFRLRAYPSALRTFYLPRIRGLVGSDGGKTNIDVIFRLGILDRILFVAFLGLVIGGSLAHDASLWLPVTLLTGFHVFFCLLAFGPEKERIEALLLKALEAREAKPPVEVDAVVDQPALPDHAPPEQPGLEKERVLRQRLIADFAGTTHRSEIESILKQKYGSSVVKPKVDSTLCVDGVGLRFEGDRLSEVFLLSDPNLK